MRVEGMVDQTLADSEQRKGKNPKSISVIKELFKHGLAEPTEDPMASKLKHEERLMLKVSVSASSIRHI